MRNRLKEIQKYLKQHPTENYVSVGERFGVGRQRIQQIAKASGLPPRRRQVNTCAVCGESISLGKNSTKKSRVRGMCTSCWELQKWLSVESHRKWFTCHQCLTSFTVTNSVLRQRGYTDRNGPSHCSLACRRAAGRERRQKGSDIELLRYLIETENADRKEGDG